MKEKLWTWLFVAYVAVLAVGTVDQVFLDMMIFPPALDRQLLGMVDVLRTRDLQGVEDARSAAGRARDRLAGIRLEPAPSDLENRLGTYARTGTSPEEGSRLLAEARLQAVANLIDNDEFSLAICIRALDPDLILKLWVPGLSSDDLQVKEGCLEALKKISGQADGFGFDPKAETVLQREAIARWRDWHQRFMEERRKPLPPSQQIQPATAPAPAVTPAAPPTATSAP